MSKSFGTRGRSRSRDTRMGRLEYLNNLTDEKLCEELKWNNILHKRGIPLGLELDERESYIKSILKKRRYTCRSGTRGRSRSRSRRGTRSRSRRGTRSRSRSRDTGLNATELHEMDEYR